MHTRRARTRTSSARRAAVRNFAATPPDTPTPTTGRPAFEHALACALAGDSGPVVACSALKRAYRDHLRSCAPRLTFVHLAGPWALIAERMADRADHFMPLSLLDDQFATLQPLEPDEVGTTVPIDGPVKIVVRRALDNLA